MTGSKVVLHTRVREYTQSTQNESFSQKYNCGTKYFTVDYNRINACSPLPLLFQSHLEF